MKKKFTGAAALGLCLALGISMGASADSRKVVTLGADLTDQQKQIVMNYFVVSVWEMFIKTVPLRLILMMNSSANANVRSWHREKWSR